MLHSYKELADRDYPGWDDHNGGIGKAGTDWPYEVKTRSTGRNRGTTYKSYYKDYGKIPLNLAAVTVFLSDIGHRVKCIAKMVFSFKYKSKNPEDTGEIGLHKWECLKLKKQTGYYFKSPDNQDLPYQDFCRKAHCIYLHHFNDHSCCNVSWCKVLKSERQDDPLPFTENYLKRFRCKDKDRELFLLLKKGFETYLTADSMLKQIYHKYSTNKNESLNRSISSVAPKDRYFSGTMSLSDRISNVVITHSVGYLKGYQRVLMKVHAKLHMLPVLKEWCRRKDRINEVLQVHYKKPAVKKKRTEAINAEINAGIQRKARSKKQGYDYGSGLAFLDGKFYADSSEDEEEVKVSLLLDNSSSRNNNEAQRVLAAAAASVGVAENDDETIQVL